MEAGYLNMKQLVEYSGMSDKALRRLIHDGELLCFRHTPRGRILVRREWFDEYVDRMLLKEQGVPADVIEIRDDIFERLSA